MSQGKKDGMLAKNNNVETFVSVRNLKKSVSFDSSDSGAKCLPRGSGVWSQSEYSEGSSTAASPNAIHFTTELRLMIPGLYF